MNQVYSLEHAIDLARRMTTSDALWEADKAKGKELLRLLRDPKENINVIITHAEYFKRKSAVPREADYFRDYGQGTQMYRDMANALDELIKEISIS